MGTCMRYIHTKHHNNFNSYKNNENGFLSSNCTGRINYGTIKNGLFSLPTDKFHTCKIQGTEQVKSFSFVFWKKLGKQKLLSKLTDLYKLSWSALTGQTKCKQTQLVGCKFD